MLLNARLLSRSERGAGLNVLQGRIHVGEPSNKESRGGAGWVTRVGGIGGMQQGHSPHQSEACDRNCIYIRKITTHVIYKFIIFVIMTSHKCEEYNYGASTAPNLSRWPTNGRKHDGRIRSTERNDQGAKAVAPTALSLKTLSTVAVFVLLCTSALYAYWGSPGVRGSLGSNSRLWPSELPCGILCDKAKAADTTTCKSFLDAVVTA